MKSKKNNWASIITVILLLFTMVASVIAYNVNLRDDVIINRDHILECKENYEQIENIIEFNNNRLIVVETNYRHIQDSLNRIESKVGDLE